MKQVIKVALVAAALLGMQRLGFAAEDLRGQAQQQARGAPVGLEKTNRSDKSTDLASLIDQASEKPVLQKAHLPMSTKASSKQSTDRKSGWDNVWVDACGF